MSATVQEPLGDAERATARETFYRIVNHAPPVIHLKALTRKTSQPSPTTYSAVLRAQAGANAAETYLGTEERLATMRAECLVRDRHRCVVSHEFNAFEFRLRTSLHGNNARDDNGILFSNQDSLKFDVLEVAHILPHSLMKSSTGAAMDASRQAALAVLDMFDHGVVHLINGIDIDRPLNGLTLKPLMRCYFGSFEIYFEAVDQYNMYRIQSFTAPNDRVLHLPVSRLLALHCAIAHILHLSGAGEYIGWVLKDMEERTVHADGSSAFARPASLRLGGWLDGAVCS